MYYIINKIKQLCFVKQKLYLLKLVGPADLLCPMLTPGSSVVSH